MGMFFMKSFKKSAVCFLCVASCFNFAISTAKSETFDAAAFAEIRQRIQISEEQSINFGILLVTAGNAGNASISPTGSISTQNISSQAGSSIRSGRFNASGTPNSALSISFQDGILNGSGGSMVLNNLNHDAGSTPGFDINGTLTFSIGGTLLVNADQPTGLYSGSYQITLDYQ